MDQTVPLSNIAPLAKQFKRNNLTFSFTYGTNTAVASPEHVAVYDEVKVMAGGFDRRDSTAKRLNDCRSRSRAVRGPERCARPRPVTGDEEDGCPNRS